MLLVVVALHELAAHCWFKTPGWGLHSEKHHSFVMLFRSIGLLLHSEDQFEAVTPLDWALEVEQLGPHPQVHLSYLRTEHRGVRLESCL